MRRLQKLAVISNISVEPFFIPVLQEDMQSQNGQAAVYAVPYQEYRQSEYLTRLKETDIAIVWLNLEILLPEIQNGVTDSIWKEQKTEEIQRLCQDVAEYIALHSNAKIFWLLFEDYFLHMPVVTGHRDGSFAMNFSAKNKYRWNFPYSKSLTSCQEK